MATLHADSTTSVENKLAFIQKAVVAIFVVYLAWLSAQLTWFLLEEEQQAVPQTVSQRDTQSQASQRVVRQVARYNLFGEAGRLPIPVETKKEAPKTNLRLSLKGVFTGEGAASSGAIIEEIGRGAESYRIGDALPGGATLAEVYADRVLIDRNGRLEALYFDEANPNNSGIAVVTREERPQPQQLSTPEEFIDEASRRIAENPERALSSVGLGFAEDGGYVFQGNNPMLSNMNLQKGDVIRSVNGQTLGDINQDKDLMRSLADQDSVEIEVVRDGASFYVNYPLR